LKVIAIFFRHPYYDETRYHHHIETDFRRAAMRSYPTSQYGCSKRLYYYFHTPAEWREQVEELLVALKALTFAQVSLMNWEMIELLHPSSSRFLRRIQMRQKEEDLLMKSAVDKEETCVETESTDSDFYSTY
jgi:hypothetical protein